MSAVFIEGAPKMKRIAGLRKTCFLQIVPRWQIEINIDYLGRCTNCYAIATCPVRGMYSLFVVQQFGAKCRARCAGQVL